ncbi:M15 family metallopeptidase [Desulfomonile tiedjei]|uniref:D-alanyl-D-alanine dipeptidase n=1 Tax=Desulfomonile tiedjei (strain ATCC 49306 / DSM 6799 / DCB-1) TaxID=706587 RepID=I4CDW4_DESTA|nr:M15 family metallopeptidase [Desulfomonile tiedjei]AFM27755.1 D-alanyl-D-alanine dipeptidase [Desulfomonile tiedjei DSM 6799]
MTRTCAFFLVWCSVYSHLAALTRESSAWSLPDHFVYVEDVIPNVKVDLRYFTDRNFLGRRVDGYLKPRLILTREAAEALGKVREELNGFGLDLKIFDGYRPQRALNDFVRWAKDPSDMKTQTEYYPKFEKKEDLFKEQYLVERSSHSRGSAVDLTIVFSDRQGGTSELEMGTPFDFFGPESHPASALVSAECRAHRMLLQVIIMGPTL